jgi:Fe-Mn family superoxide dismutase
MAFTLPELTYDFDALEPQIDARTMEIHHDKHHAGYVKKLNAALEGHDELLAMDVRDLLPKINEVVPEEKRTAVKNHGGGHANHTLFWEIMTPGGASEPTGALLDAINNNCGDFETFKKHFSETAAGQFGSGWGWLVVKDDGKVEIISTSNQDSPLMEGLTPIMGIDVWEHAYYLKYQNLRADYIEQWFNVINWDKVAEHYEAARK